MRELIANHSKLVATVPNNLTHNEKAVRATMSPGEAADRFATRHLIDAYAHCADRRDAKGQMALFTENTAFHVFMHSASAEPTYVLHGGDALARSSPISTGIARPHISTVKAFSVSTVIGPEATAIVWLTTSRWRATNAH